MAIDFTELLDEMEEKQDGFEFKDFGDAKYAEVGDYLAKLTKIDDRESKNGSRGVHFMFEVTAPEAHVGETVEMRFFPESSEVGERMLGEFAFKMMKMGEYKLPRTKLKSLDTMIGYLTELTEFSGESFKFSVRPQKGNSQYTNTFCNGRPAEDYVPKGKDMTFVKPAVTAIANGMAEQGIDDDELPF